MNSVLHTPHKTMDEMSLYFVNDIAVIVMKRGQNRVNPVFLNAFHTFLDEVERNESCQGLITTSTGKFFSNGLDLEYMASFPALDTTRNLVGFLILLKRLLILPVPTLAAINGHAFAGGAMLAFAHDLRTMNAEKGWICLNEVFNSFRFTMSMLILLESKLGKENCGDALVMGKKYTAQDALNSNMVHAIQPQPLLFQESVQVLKSYSGKGYPRESLRNMKEDIYREILDHFQKNKIEELYEQKELPGDLSLVSRL